MRARSCALSEQNRPAPPRCAVRKHHALARAGAERRRRAPPARNSTASATATDAPAAARPRQPRGYPPRVHLSRVLRAVMGRAARRPLAVSLVVGLLAVAGGALALARLQPSAATDTLVGRGTASFAATERLHQRFGDDAVYVLVRQPLTETTLTADLAPRARPRGLPLGQRAEGPGAARRGGRAVRAARADQAGQGRLRARDVPQRGRRADPGPVPGAERGQGGAGRPGGEGGARARPLAGPQREGGQEARRAGQAARLRPVRAQHAAARPEVRDHARRRSSTTRASSRGSSSTRAARRARRRRASPTSSRRRTAR